MSGSVSSLSLICLLLALGASHAAPGQTLALEACRIADASGLSTLPARCGRLRRAENPEHPEGRQIELFVAVVSALDRDPAPDPLTVLAGGPGAAATEFYVSYAGAFEPVRRNRDIVLVDQRGTGSSHPLDCEFDELEAALEESPEMMRDAATRCLAQLDADPRFYTSSVAVRDLDAVREALGYASLNLYGGSYGTRVALHYLRRFPERTRSLILDGVLAADLNVGPDIALDAQAALMAVLARCAAEPACHERFGDPRQAFDTLMRDVRASPRDLTVADPLTGAPQALRFGGPELAVAVRLLSYATSTASLLPLLLHQAQAAEDFEPLGAQTLLVTSRLAAALSYGMHNAVVCAEDAPFYELPPERRTALAQTYLGLMQVDGIVEICKVWPRGVMDEDFKTPVSSDKPVLLLSGEFDPVTPPANAARAQATLRNSRHVIGRGQGHGLAAIGCVPSLMAKFVNDTAPETLDASCAERISPAPFFLSFSGPGP